MVNREHILACDANCSLTFQMAQEGISPGKVPISIMLYIDGDRPACSARLFNNYLAARARASLHPRRGAAGGWTPPPLVRRPSRPGVIRARTRRRCHGNK
jgi:hypothetical protein